MNQLQGQNLISNYSFENHGPCPHNIGCPYIKVPGQNLHPDIIQGRYFDWYDASIRYSHFTGSGQIWIIYPNLYYPITINFLLDSILNNQNLNAFNGDHFFAFSIVKARQFFGVNWNWVISVPIISIPLKKTTEIDKYCGYFFVRSDSRNSFQINNIDIALSKDSIVSLANLPSFSFSNTDIVNNSLVVSINDSSINKSDKWRKVLFNVSVNDHYNHFSLGIFDPNLSPSSFNVIDSSTSLSRRRNFNNDPQAMFQSFYSFVFFDDFHFYKCSDTLFTVQLPADTTLCEGETLQLTAQVIDSTYMLENETRHYLWSTGDTTPSITVNQAGTYWVQVSIDGLYSAYDTIVVNYIYNFSPQIAPYPDTLCLGQSAWLGVQVPQEVSILWSNGDSTATTQIYEAGVYYVHTYNECFSYTDTLVVYEKDCSPPPVVDYPIYIPNAFTPNGDGVNDCFQVSAENVADYHIQIFNRWGTMVYSSTDPKECWDGQYQGKPVQEGVYLYLIRYTDRDGNPQTPKRGEIVLYR
jgi:gliding motility-associated-like protein